MSNNGTWLEELFNDSKALDLSKFLGKYKEQIFTSSEKFDIRYVFAIQAIDILRELNLYDKIDLDEFKKAYKLFKECIESGNKTELKERIKKLFYVV